MTGLVSWLNSDRDAVGPALNTFKVSRLELAGPNHRYWTGHDWRVALTLRRWPEKDAKVGSVWPISNIADFDVGGWRRVGGNELDRKVDFLAPGFADSINREKSDHLLGQRGVVKSAG